MKIRRAHIVPLSRQASDELRNLQRLTGEAISKYRASMLQLLAIEAIVYRAGGCWVQGQQAGSSKSDFVDGPQLSWLDLSRLIIDWS
jgi:hypothetical protein